MPLIVINDQMDFISLKDLNIFLFIGIIRKSDNPERK
jgi:hypothetical protein